METLTIVYPSSIKKYSGAIELCKTKYGHSFRVRMRGKHHLYKVFQTPEAEAFLKEYNISHSLPIKDIMIFHNDHVEVNVGYVRWMKVSFEDLDLVENYIWHESKGRYVNTWDGRKRIAFHLSRPY